MGDEPYPEVSRGTGYGKGPIAAITAIQAVKWAKRGRVCING